MDAVSSFYKKKELEELGIRRIGKDVLISRKASLYGVDQIEIGDHVRIDDFCILSGKVIIGNYIHISAYTSFFGGKKEEIIVEDYATVSSRCAVYARSDDYSGDYMTNAVIPEQYTHVCEARVCIKKYAIVGSGCTILPGVTVDEGAAVGAMSLVNRDLGQWGIYAGIPCKKLKGRSKGLLNCVTAFEENCKE